MTKYRLFIACLLLHSFYVNANDLKCENEILNKEVIRSSTSLKLVDAYLDKSYGIFSVTNILPYEISIPVCIPGYSSDVDDIWYDVYSRAIMFINLNNLDDGWMLHNALIGLEERIQDYGTCFELPIRAGEEKIFRTLVVKVEDYGMNSSDYAFRLRIMTSGENIGMAFSDPFCF